MSRVILIAEAREDALEALKVLSSLALFTGIGIPARGNGAHDTRLRDYAAPDSKSCATDA